MKKIYVHKYSGILSAFGLSLADVVVERQEPFIGCLSGPSSSSSLATALYKLARLEEDAVKSLLSQGFLKVKHLIAHAYNSPLAFILILPCRKIFLAHYF